MAATLASYDAWIKHTESLGARRSDELRALDNAVRAYQTDTSQAALTRVKNALNAWKKTQGAGDAWKKSRRNKDGYVELLTTQVEKGGDTDQAWGTSHVAHSLGKWRSAACAPILVLGATGGATGQAPSAADSAAPDTAARQAVDALNAKEVKACQAMDNAASAELWADDGVDLIQGLEPMVGKAAIAAWLNGLTPGLKGAKMVYCTIDWKQITIHGDWAYEWGINQQRIEFPPPQQPFESEGKMTLVLKRQRTGDWKIELESWNSSPKRG